MAALVHSNGVSPATAYLELDGIFEADGALEACSDVLARLRIAWCTARGGGGNLAAVPAVAQAFLLLLLPSAISDYLAVNVHGDLPGQHGG